MKTLPSIVSILLLLLTHLARADDQRIRLDIDKDIPLAEAIRQANAQFPDVQPLTQEEVLASVKAIAIEQRDIPKAVRDVYLRVVEEKVLPRGMYFSHIPVMETDRDHFDVDWKDLTLTSLPAGTKDPKIGYGYNYRIRARFISSRPLTDSERRKQSALLKRSEDTKALH